MNIKDFFGKNKLGSKGLAASICVCLLAVGGVGIYSYKKTADKINDQIISHNADTLNSSKSDAAVNVDESAEADVKQTEVPKSSEAEIETAAFADESGEDAKEAEASLDEDVLKTNTVSLAMVRPLNGEVLCEFSDGELVKSSTLNVWKTHDGADIAGNLNEKVKSMTSGTVTSVYEDQLMGVCVVIDHGSGLEGYYCSLSEDVSVIEGQEVSAGTIIGTVGDTADSEIKEASHLHFGLKKNGEWIDPIAFISGEGS